MTQEDIDRLPRQEFNRDMLNIDTSEQSCRFCDDPNSILIKETCCTGCNKLVE